MRSRGITLLELLISIALILILAGTAIPLFIDLIKDARISASLNNLKADLYLARSAAIRYNKHTIICPSNNSNSDCSDAADWEKGWVVFVDNNKDGQCGSNSGLCADKGKVIKIGKGIKSRDMKMRGYGHRNYRIRYDPMGFSYAYNGKIVACDDRGEDKARGIFIANSGKVRDSEKSDKLKCD